VIANAIITEFITESVNGLDDPEQTARRALSRAHRAYVLETGRIVKSGTHAELLGAPVTNAWLGVASAANTLTKGLIQMKITRSRTLLGVVGAVALSVSLAACGSSSNNSSAGSSASPTAVTSVDPSLAAKVPADIKSKGTLTIGADASYAPNEYLAPDGKTVIGWDVDLFNAVAAKLGLKTQWQNAKFTTIIPAVQSGKYNFGVSSFSINAQREAQVNMVSYYNAGTQWVQKTGGSVDPNNACGKKVAVQTGTVQADDVAARSTKCTAAAKPAIKIDQYQLQSDATAAVVSGKDDAMLADSPISAYAVKQTNGQLALVGSIYDAALYGYVLPKDQTDLAGAIAGAVKELITDGTYNQILTKWGVQIGAITNPTVNPTA
jgi:polar amino acid transport system substrate-binding protein